MTPAAILATIPNELLRRRPEPDNQLHAAKALAQWLLDRGHRPTLLEIEMERQKRAASEPSDYTERKAQR